MLDYAANGIAYWSIEQIIAAFHATAQRDGKEPDELLSSFLEGADPEAYWRQVEANLRSGRIRMLFVADRIPKELARIVEFLNEQMRPAEVLAVEVEQFVNAAGVRTLVPRLVGATERARTAKAVGGPRSLPSEAEWLDELEGSFGSRSRQGAERAIAWFRAGQCEVGPTDTGDSMVARLLRTDGKPTWPFFLRKSTGRLEISFQRLASVPQFRDEEVRQELLARFALLPTQTFTTGKTTGWPALALEDLLDDDLWHAFTDLAVEILAGIGGGRTGRGAG
ncbi:hypothetical protein [Geminicoccus roseus]|uniref:hypothetical protein n=1 Tax=Geminicoccus roseus TaxID=404900 RepID=UPI0004108ED7|nr:hypothetical protein [Geminicoccus roseus]